MESEEDDDESEDDETSEVDTGPNAKEKTANGMTHALWVTYGIIYKHGNLYFQNWIHFFRAYDKRTRHLRGDIKPLPLLTHHLCLISYASS